MDWWRRNSFTRLHCQFLHIILSVHQLVIIWWLQVYCQNSISINHKVVFDYQHISLSYYKTKILFKSNKSTSSFYMTSEYSKWFKNISATSIMCLDLPNCCLKITVQSFVGLNRSLPITRDCMVMVLKD